MPKLTAQQLAQLADEALSTRITVPASGPDGKITLKLPYRPDTSDPRDEQITRDEYHKRVTTAIAIMLAESGGWTDARCLDGPLPTGVAPRAGISPNCNRPGNGYDRGLWQFNSKAWPQITDSAADTPAAATSYALNASRNFAQWGPWNGSKGLDPSSPQWAEAKAAYTARAGVVIDDTPGPSSVGELIPWADGLGKLLSFITAASFWKRVGLGAAGVGLVIFAVSQTDLGRKVL